MYQRGRNRRSINRTDGANVASDVTNLGEADEVSAPLDAKAIQNVSSPAVNDKDIINSKDLKFNRFNLDSI